MPATQLPRVRDTKPHGAMASLPVTPVPTILPHAAAYRLLFTPHGGPCVETYVGGALAASLRSGTGGLGPWGPPLGPLAAPPQRPHQLGTPVGWWHLQQQRKRCSSE